MRSTFAKAVAVSAGFFLVVTLLGVGRSAAPAAAADAGSQEGCLNQWLFNGLWRVQVTKVEPFMNGSQQTGWQVTEVWRNGTTQELSPGDSLLKDQQLELTSGNMLATASTTGTMSLSGIASHGMAPSAQNTFTQVFVAANLDPANKPKALDVTFDGARLATFGSQPHFSTQKYNFRFKLDCQAAGAAAQAQGGSSQIAATEGCLNQWMSNGIWKMRATAIAPDNNNDPSGPQIGWMLTEDWVNSTGRSLAPADVYMTDQYLVTTSGQNISSSNSAGTSMNFSQLDYHTFAPGASFTYQQRFRWAPFSAADAPVRLLVTFDAKSEKKRTNFPQYKHPANFRINLACTK